MVTDEERRDILEYMARKYPKGGQWDMKLKRPTNDGEGERGDSDSGQEQLPDDAS